MSGTWLSNQRRHAQLRIGRVTQGVVLPWSITEGVDGNAIPARIIITDLLVKPSEETIYAIRLYTGESRINDVNDPGYNLIHEEAWDDYTEASDALLEDRTGISYVDEDAAADASPLGTIWGDIEIQALAENSAFVIDIFYIE